MKGWIQYLQYHGRYSLLSTYWYIRHTLIYCILKRGIVFYALIYADKLALSNSSATGLQIISTAPRCHPPINTTASFGEMDISFRNAFVFLSGNRLYFIARAHCISWMVWELFATPALELLPIIRCPHTHFFAEGTSIINNKSSFFYKNLLAISSWKSLISRDTGEVLL